jgi:hypothetical protein
MPSVPIIEALPRTHVRVTGQVMRMRARPTTGIPALAVTVSDGTGSAIAVWSGRREIGGVTLGRTLVLEGVATLRAGQLEFMNPVYTLVL